MGSARWSTGVGVHVPVQPHVENLWPFEDEDGGIVEEAILGIGARADEGCKSRDLRIIGHVDGHKANVSSASTLDVGATRATTTTE